MRIRLSKATSANIIATRYEMLGNAGMAITLDAYSHVLPNMQSEAAKPMEEALRP